APARSQPRRGTARDARLLARIDGFGRGAESVAAPRLDLHEHEDARALGHDVELDAVGPRVAREDPVAAAFEMCARGGFARGAELAPRIGAGHDVLPGPEPRSVAFTELRWPAVAPHVRRRRA